MRTRARIGLYAALASSTLLSAQAHATDPKEKELCIDAADQGQQLRDQGKYALARDAFSRCARHTCPVLVSQDCTQWLHELDEKVPTAIFGARDDKDHDVTDVVVTMDGAPFVATLDGKPEPVDPGEHVFRFESPGFSPLEERERFVPGDKNRAIVIRFKGEPPKATWVPPVPPSAPRERPPPPRSGAPPATWVFGGLAVAAFGSQAYFGVTALSQRSNDFGPKGCAPRCPVAERDTIHTEFVIADVSLGVGLVSAALAAYFYFASSARAPRRAAFDFIPGPGGGVARLGAHF
jgi:hypothetical protein